MLQGNGIFTYTSPGFMVNVHILYMEHVGLFKLFANQTPLSPDSNTLYDDESSHQNWWSLQEQLFVET